MNSNRISSPVIPTVKPKIDPNSLKLPPNYHLPEAVRTPENNVRFEKLSALIKGHLTRRLLKTQKVQNIIQSMKDIMTIALQLHRESHQYPKMEDIKVSFLPSMKLSHGIFKINPAWPLNFVGCFILIFLHFEGMDFRSLFLAELN